MIDFQIEMNVRDLDKDLVALLYRLGPKVVERFLHRAGAIATASVRKNLAAGGRPTPWAPLAASTLERRGYSAHSIFMKAHYKSHEQREVERGLRSIKNLKHQRARDTVPLGGKGGTFYKSIRKSLYNYGHAIRIYPPDRKMGGGKKSLAQLMKIHESGGHSPVRKVFFLQPEDAETIMEALGLTVDEAISGKKSKMKPLSTDLLAPVSRFSRQATRYVRARRRTVRRTQRTARRAYRRAAKYVVGKKGLVPRVRKSLFGAPKRRRA